jgi:hypothetical protein
MEMEKMLQILCPEDTVNVPHEVGKQYRMIVPGGFVPSHLQLLYVYLLSGIVKEVCFYRHQRCQYPVIRRLATLTVGMFRALPKLSVEVMWTKPPVLSEVIDVVVLQCVDSRYPDLGRLSHELNGLLKAGRLLLIRVPGVRAPRSLLRTIKRVVSSPAKVIVLAHPDCAYEKAFFKPSWVHWWWRDKRPADWTFVEAKALWPESEVVLVEDDHV